MAFASLFTLPDYIAAVLDDVALMTKAAAKKTAGVAGDDLAPNANRVTGVSAERELPIVWPVAKGSFANKPVLVSAALLLSAFLPQLITPLLTAGGIYLCFEGVESCCTSFCTDMTRTMTAAKRRLTSRLKSKVQSVPTLSCPQKSSSSRCAWSNNTA